MKDEEWERMHCLFFIYIKVASAEHGANGKPVVAVVVVRVRVFRIEVEVTRVVRVRLVERRRPVVAVRGLVVEVRAVAVACGGQENGVHLFAAAACCTDGRRSLDVLRGGRRGSRHPYPHVLTASWLG